MAGSIRRRKFHSLAGQSINIGSLVEAALEAAHVPPAEIIDQKENNIRRPLCSTKVLRKQKRYR